jgi:hypothetical protein
MDMGGAVAEAPNILQSPMEVLQDLIRMQDEGLNKQRVEKWLQLVANAEERGIQLSYVPYRKTMLRLGQTMPDDLYVIVEVPGFQWLAKKFASLSPRPNAFYFPGPPVVRGGQAPQGNLSGVRTVVLVTPPIETMTVQLSVTQGTAEYSEEDIKPSSGIEQEYWNTALAELEELLPQIDPEGARQLSGIRVTTTEAVVPGSVTSPYPGSIREIVNRGGTQYIAVSTDALGIPVDLYQAVFDAAKVYRNARVQEIQAAGGDPETDRSLEEFDENILSLQKKVGWISRQPTSAAKSIESIGFNAEAAQTHINILRALQDQLYKQRQRTTDQAARQNISASIDQLSRLAAAPQTELDSIPMAFRSPSNEDRARGYSNLVPLSTPNGRYEYNKAQRALKRVEYFPVPADHDLAVQVAQDVEVGTALTTPREVAPRHKIEVEMVAADSALQPRRVGTKNVTPARAQVTLFFQPRPVTNEVLVSTQSPMFPIPVRRAYDVMFKEVDAEIGQSLDTTGSAPEWFMAEVERLGRGPTDEEATAIVQREARQRIAFDQIDDFVLPVNTWLASYFEPFVAAANDAFLASGDEPAMSKEEFADRYYTAQGSEYPGISFLPDLVEKGKEEAKKPRVLEMARKALMRPTKREPQPAEPSKEQIIEKAEKLAAPRPTTGPVFYYLLTFFDAANEVIWEGKVGLDRIPLDENIIPEGYKVKNSDRGRISMPLDPADPNNLGYLAAQRRSGLNAVQRRAVAMQARFASWRPEPGSTEAEKRGELIGTIMAQERVARQQAGKPEGPIGRLGIVRGRDMKPSSAEYRPYQEGVSYPSQSRQTINQYSAFELRDMGMDATAVFSHIPENRFDAYLNYFIPQAIAEKDGILRPAAVDWAVTEQNRLDGRLKATQTVGSSEEVKGRIAKLLGRSGAPAGIPQKENPMASRLLNNARYLQLAQKTGRVMGRKFRGNPGLGDDDVDVDIEEAESIEVPAARAESTGRPTLREQAARSDRSLPGTLRFFDEMMADPGRVYVEGEMSAQEGLAYREASAIFSESEEYREYSARIHAEAQRAVVELNELNEKVNAARQAAAREAEETASRTAAPETAAPPPPRATRRRRAAAAAAAEPSATAYTTPEPEEEEAPQKRTRASKKATRTETAGTPAEKLAAAEQSLAQAIVDASTAYSDLYTLLRDSKSGAAAIQAAKANFENKHSFVAAYLLRRNEQFAQVHGPDALIADLGAKHRRMMERATAAFARGPDSVNEKLSSRVREDLLNRLAFELGYDGTPLISPDRLLAKRGIEPIRLTSPDDAAEAQARATRRGGPPLATSPVRYSAVTSPALDAALIAARGQGSLRRVRPKPTSTMILQMEGAKGSENIQPDVYTAPKGVLDRGFDRVEGVPKRSIILWMSPRSDHIIRYTTGPAPTDASGRTDVEMVGQFALRPGQKWREMLNTALAHSVAWYSDVLKGPGRVEKYDLWLGRSGWPYLYRLFSAKSPNPISVPLLLSRMEDMGLEVQGSTEDYLRVAIAKSKVAKGNIVPWLLLPPDFNENTPDLEMIDELRQDWMAYQAAIERTRKTIPVGDLDVYGRDLMSIYEEQDAVGRYAAGTEAAFASQSEMSPILLVPPGIYDGEGRALKGNTDADTLTNVVFTAVRHAVQPDGKYRLTLVDGNMFSSQRNSVMGALLSDDFKRLTLTDRGQLRERSGDNLIPAPLAAAIQFAAKEGDIKGEIARKTAARTGEPMTALYEPLIITVVLPDTYRAQAVVLQDLPRRILGDKMPTMEREGVTVDLIQVDTSFSAQSAGDLVKATANALETALAGSAGALLIADVPDTPQAGGRNEGNVDDYLFFNPRLAGEIAKVVAANIGSISIIKLLGPAAQGHITEFKKLIVEFMDKRLRSEMGAEELPFMALKSKLPALARKFRVPAEALTAALAPLEGQTVTVRDLHTAMTNAAWSRLDANQWNSLVIVREPYDRDEPGMSENPLRRNFNRRMRIDMASRYMRQVPWMWPDR